LVPSRFAPAPLRRRHSTTPPHPRTMPSLSKVCVALALLARPSGGEEIAGYVAPPAVQAEGVTTGIVSANPPGCAATLADATYELTRGSTLVFEATKRCARPNRIQRFRGEETDFDEFKCTSTIFKLLSKYSEASSDIFDSMFLCFSVQQGCAQLITSAMKNLFDAATSLTATTKLCEPGGTPEDGFFCWDATWVIVDKALKAAKNIDTAILQCQIEQPEPEGDESPEPEAAEDEELAASSWGGSSPFSVEGAMEAVKALGSERRLDAAEQLV